MRNLCTRWKARAAGVRRWAAARRRLRRCGSRLLHPLRIRWRRRYRYVLTVPVRWRLLRWGDTPLARLLKLKPRMLSSRANVARVPFKGARCERLRLWLWEKHSVNVGIILSLVIGIGMCLIALACSSAITIPMLGIQGDIDGIPMMIIAVAAYLGTLFGFLQAVTIFAVQLRSQHDTAMLALTPLIARRYFAFIILGIIAGLTIANLLAAIATPLLAVDRGALGVMSWLNLISVPVATLVAFWYIARIVSDAGESDMDVALPVLRATMRAQTHAEAKRLKMLNEYRHCLGKAGIEYNPFIDSGVREVSSATTRIVFSGPGMLHDLDCHRMDDVARLLKDLPTRPQAAVSIAIGQSFRSDSALILSWDSGGAPHGSGATTEQVSEALREKLRSALAQAFLVRREAQA